MSDIHPFMPTVARWRKHLVSKMPYNQTWAIMVKVIFDENLPARAAMSDGGCMYIHPTMNRDLSDEEGAYLLAHELDHFICRHGRRRMGRNAMLMDGSGQMICAWNICCDAVINERLNTITGMKMPKNEGITYKTIGWNQPDNKHPLPEELYDWLLRDKKDGGAGLKKISVTVGPCGSASDGEKKPWETHDAVIGDSERRTELEKYRNILKSHESKQAGTVPGSLLREAGVFTETESNLERVYRMLNRFTDQCHGHTEITFRKRSRRAIQGLILPGVIGRKPDVVLIEDESGSMCNDHDRVLARGVVQSFLGRFETVKYMAGDTRPTFLGEISNLDEVVSAAGGGTDMALLMNEAHERWPSACIILITDGYTGYCDPLPIRTFVLLTRPEQMSSVPDWCECVSL